MSKKRKMDCIIEKFSSTLVLEEKPDIHTQLKEHSQKIESIIANQKKIISMLQELFPNETVKDSESGNEYKYFFYS